VLYIYTGAANLKQVLIVQEGVADILSELLKRKDLTPKDRWKICLTFANLSMHRTTSLQPFFDSLFNFRIAFLSIFCYYSAQNVPRLKELNAFEQIQQCVLNEGSSIWNSVINPLFFVRSQYVSLMFVSSSFELK
jgi:hypothetical protein